MISTNFLNKNDNKNEIMVSYSVDFPTLETQSEADYFLYKPPIIGRRSHSRHTILLLYFADLLFRDINLRNF